MTLALIQESLQLILHTNTRNGDALRTPSITIISGKYLSGSQYVIEIIHRLALAHENDISQRLALGQGIDLIQDITSREAAFETLLTSLAEQAVHLTAHLARHAERGTIAVRNIDRLNEFIATSHRKQILDGAIHGALTIDGIHRTNHELLREPLAISLRDIGHLVDAPHMLLIEPFHDLASRKLGHTQRLYCRLQFVEAHA